MCTFFKKGKHLHPCLPIPHTRVMPWYTDCFYWCLKSFTLFNLKKLHYLTLYFCFFLLDEQNNSPSPTHQEMGMTIDQRVSVQDPFQSPKYPFAIFFIYLHKTLVSFFKYFLVVLLMVKVKTLWAVCFWSCHPSRLMLGSDVGGGGASPTPLYWSFVLHLFQYPPTIHPPSKGDKNYQK